MRFTKRARNSERNSWAAYISSPRKDGSSSFSLLYASLYALFSSSSSATASRSVNSSTGRKPVASGRIDWLLMRNCSGVFGAEKRISEARHQSSRKKHSTEQPEKGAQMHCNYQEKTVHLRRVCRPVRRGNAGEESGECFQSRRRIEGRKEAPATNRSFRVPPALLPFREGRAELE